MRLKRLYTSLAINVFSNVYSLTPFRITPRGVTDGGRGVSGVNDGGAGVSVA